MARPIAPRFEITVLKDKAVGDKSQVPATDATIKFYRSGATVSQDVVIPAFAESALVNVFDPGLLVVNDFVRPGTGAGPGTLVVSEVSKTQLKISSSMGSDVTLGVGMRLVPTNNPPNVYVDPLCSAALGSFLNVDPQGRASAYLASNRVDYDVAIPGQTPRLYVDGAGLIGRSDQRWSDLRDFGGKLQAAINALPPDGGIVFVPRGILLLSSGVTVNTPNVTIMGEQAGSIIRAAAPNSYDLITVNQTNFQLRDLTLDGYAGQHDPAGKCCLHMSGLGATIDATLQNVTIMGGARYGLWAQDVHVLLAEACHFDSNPGSGACVEWLVSPNVDAAQFIACTFSRNGDRGCVAVALAVLGFLGCTFDGNKGGADPQQGNGLDAIGCSRVDILSSFFTNPDSAQAPAQFIRLNSCPGAVVDGCRFEGGPTAPERPLQGVLFMNSSSARLSSCAGNSLTNYLGVFDSQSLDVVELGNSEVQQPVPRIACQADAQRLVGMSRLSISAPCVATEADLPNNIQNVLPGALAWVKNTGQLKVWSGAPPWKTVTLTAPVNP